MIKILFGIAVVAFGTFCGYVFTKKYRRRKLFFSQLYEFNERFISEISYYRRPLMEFSSKYTYKGEFQDFLEIVFGNMDKSPVFIAENLNKDVFYFLTKEEIGVLEDYFQMIGKGDSASQKAYFTSIKDTLSKLKTQAVAENKRYGDLYVKLGFLCGLFILILML